MPNIALGERYEQELDLLIKEGQFANRSEAVRAAIRALYEALPKETRMQVAARAYSDGVTLGRAAEIGRLSYGELRKLLASQKLLDDARPVHSSAHK